MTTALPPDPTAWEQGSIALQRDDSGMLGGQVVLGQVAYHIRSWRQGGDKFHILFEVQPVSDPEFEALVTQLGRKVGG